MYHHISIQITSQIPMTESIGHKHRQSLEQRLWILNIRTGPREKKKRCWQNVHPCTQRYSIGQPMANMIPGTYRENEPNQMKHCQWLLRKNRIGWKMYGYHPCLTTVAPQLFTWLDKPIVEIQTTKEVMRNQTKEIYRSPTPIYNETVQFSRASKTFHLKKSTYVHANLHSIQFLYESETH